MGDSLDFKLKAPLNHSWIKHGPLQFSLLSVSKRQYNNSNNLSSTTSDASSQNTDVNHDSKVAKVSETDKLVNPTTTATGTNGQELLYQFFSTHIYIINALGIVSLLPLVLDCLPISGATNNNNNNNHYVNRQQLSGCLHLFLSPITIPCLLFFNLVHKNSRKTTFIMAIGSVLLGNFTGISYCSRWSGTEWALTSLSLSLMLGTFQLLMIINKTNTAIVMISTACSVVVWGLSISALFLPMSLTRRCYQSTIPCILWLFWQATRNQKNRNPTSFSDIDV